MSLERRIAGPFLNEGEIARIVAVLKQLIGDATRFFASGGHEPKKQFANFSDFVGLGLYSRDNS